MKKEQVKCQQCRHYIDKEDAQIVEKISITNNKREIYFCPLCRKNYEIVDNSGGYVRYYKKGGLILVDEFGVLFEDDEIKRSKGNYLIYVYLSVGLYIFIAWFFYQLGQILI